MKRTLVLIAAALTACGGSQKLTAEEASTAMPGASQAQLGTPQGGAALTAVSALSFQTAEYAAATQTLAGSVNMGVAWTLGIVEAVVTTFPPTSCAGDTCVWGPGSDALDVNDWEITVTKKDTNDYTWTMQGKSKVDPAATWISFVSGEAFTTGVKHVGHGTLSIDLDAAAGLARKTTDPAPQSGKITGTYDNTSGRHVSLQFIGTQDDKVPAQKVNAAYQFASATAGGDLQIATRNLTTGTELLLHSRWTDVGAGRADANFSQPAAGAQAAVNISRSQCWDGATTLFNLTYQLTTPPFAGSGDTGVETSCVFSPAVPPTITVP
jgi:hypothetical protein